MNSYIRILCFLFLSCISLQVLANPSVIQLSVKGPIGPATAEYISDGIDQAEDLKADVVVIELNTPGGLLTSTRALIESITTSAVPVVTYVAPSGARATSAGTFIMYASHFAAMAPGTHIGAATPVALGGASPEKNDDGQPSAMEKKVLSDSTAYIRSLAQLRGRNAEWAEQAVVNANSLSATEALRLGVINFLSPTLDDLLKQLNGKTIQMPNQKVTLSIKPNSIQVIEPTWRQQLLSTITHPSIALVLLVAGLVGIYVEFSQPGLIVPGVFGVIALLLAGYALHILPINYIGLGLLILGMVLWCVEVILGGFGVLAIAGTISFVLGGVMLFDQAALGYAIPLGTLLGIAASGAIVCLLIARMAWASHRRPVVMSGSGVVGHVGVVEIRNDVAWVKVSGEWWHVESESHLSEGDEVKVTSINDLILTVELTKKNN